MTKCKADCACNDNGECIRRYTGLQCRDKVIADVIAKRAENQKQKAAVRH